MRRIAAVALVLLVAGCGSTPTESGDSSTPPEATTSSVPLPGEPPTAATAAPVTSEGTTTSTAATTTTAPVDEDLPVFIATLEELLVGTVYEGEALTEPDLFVATGRLLCERLDQGATPDEVLIEYLDELTGGAGAATDDELVLAGALLGASVGALCPEHADSMG